jgi:CRP-like cAMP-binding protein
MIIRNSSVLRATEPIWMHQREPPQPPRLPLDTLAIRLECGRGQMIYEEDSPVKYWYRVQSGVARRFSARADGRRQIVDLLLPGDSFGFGARGKHHFAVRGGDRRYRHHALPPRALKHLPKSEPRIACELREAACEAISRLHALILNLGRTTAEEKVRHFLVRMAERLSGGPADSVVLPMSREDIADYLALFGREGKPFSDPAETLPGDPDDRNSTHQDPRSHRARQRVRGRIRSFRHAAPRRTVSNVAYLLWLIQCRHWR